MALGVFPRLEMIKYEDRDWKKVADLLEVCQCMSRFPFGRVTDSIEQY